MATKKVATIYETDNYGMFKVLEGNRDITHAKKIIKSIEEIGMLMRPVLVNERFEIIDGQGMFTACKYLHIPVRYVVQEGIGIRQAQYLNMYQTNWRVNDYIKSYSKGSEAKEEYINLDAVMRQFPEYDKRVVINAASEDGSINVSMSDIKFGKYDGMDFDGMNRAIKRLTILRDFNKILKSTKYRVNYQIALVYVIALSENNPIISLEQLYDGLDKWLKTCDIAPKIMDAVKNVDYCYNYHRRDESRFDIEKSYKDLMRSKKVKNRRDYYVRNMK